jgi:indolepyruvate ferredoxin oxidoreductase beta subunit
MSARRDKEGGGLMPVPERQQIVLSGLGGQGILFVTRLLAETAISQGYRTLTAETHGMAQRGGVVVSHLKAGDFSSPLVRPGMADILILLKADNLMLHGSFLKVGGAVIVNAPSTFDDIASFAMDADAAAREIDQHRSMNLILTGFAVSVLNSNGRSVFCSPDDVRTVLSQKLSGRNKLLAASLSAFDHGVHCGERECNG